MPLPLPAPAARLALAVGASLTLAAGATAPPARAQNVGGAQFAALPGTASAQPVADSALHFVMTERYELYAPDTQSLRTSREALDFAVAQFRRYVGAEPPTVAVIVVTDTAAGRADDAGEFAARGMPVVRWVAPSGADAQDGAAAAAALSHEACHAFLSGYARRQSGAPGSAGQLDDAGAERYPHAGIPDWLDEGLATLCEDPALQQRRAAAMRDALGTRIPIAELFTMRNPLAPKRPAAPPAVGRQEAGPAAASRDVAPAVLVNGVALSAERVARAETFYVEVSSVAQYLAARDGDGVIGRLIDGALAGRPSAQVLAGGGRRRDAAALERDWVRWVEGSGGKR